MQLLEHASRHEKESRELASELHDAMTLGASLRRQLEQLAPLMQETTDECTNATSAEEAAGIANSAKAAEPEEPINSVEVWLNMSPDDQEEEQHNASMNQCSGQGYTSQVYISVEPDGEVSGTSEALTANPTSPRATVPVSPRGARVRRNATAALVAAVSVSLSVRDLSEIKALKRPAPPLRMLMEVCCILFGIPPTKQVGASPRTPRISQLDYWEAARRHLLSDPFLPAKLRDFDASRLTAAQRARVVRCLAEPEFTADRVMNCSKAAAELYFWVRTVAERPGFAPSAGSVALARNRTPQRDTSK